MVPGLGIGTYPTRPLACRRNYASLEVYHTPRGRNLQEVVGYERDPANGLVEGASDAHVCNIGPSPQSRPHYVLCCKTLAESGEEENNDRSDDGQQQLEHDLCARLEDWVEESSDRLLVLPPAR